MNKTDVEMIAHKAWLQDMLEKITKKTNTDIKETQQMATRKTALELATKKLEEALSRNYEETSGIKREGDRIIIPEDRTYREVADELMRYEKKMEEAVQTHAQFDGHPNDCLVAFYRSVQDSFGQIIGAQRETFFGTIPGRSMTIPIGYDETMTVPVGNAEIPGLNLQLQISPHFDEDHETGGWLDVVFTYRRKYEPLIKRIEETARKYIRENSIFRGKAIDSKFNFLNVESFDPARVVYSMDEFRQINANIFQPIINTERWLASGSSLKRGILLHGKYGTGKTLTALYTAKVAVEHGWTFVLVYNTDNLVRILKFAKHMQPCVVFFEDLDSETSGERNTAINEILNTVDGALTKSSKVMAIYTTNHIENISDAMKRPGRLDSFIQMGCLDQDTVLRMIEAIARDRKGESTIEGDLNADALWEAAHGYSPAFIVEAVTKAKAYALAREDRTNGKSPKNIKINNDDLVSACKELRFQFEEMERGVKPAEIHLNKAMEDIVDDRVNKALETSLKELKEQVEYVYQQM